MNYKKTFEKIFKKKILLILLAIGILMMLMPGFKSSETDESSLKDVSTINEKKLEKILCKITGVESVSVFITYRDSGKVEYAYDINSSTNQKDLEIKISDKKPLVSRSLNPEIEGVLVVVKGANVDRFELCSTIKAVTGAPLHRICVML